MKATTKIKNLEELKARQVMLNAEQSLLGQEIVSQGKTLLLSLLVITLVKPADPLTIIKVDGKINISAKFFSYLLPLVVNRTLFRKSGFITRIVMAMIARRVGKQMGSKVARWLLNTLEKYLSSLKPVAPRLPRHVTQHRYFADQTYKMNS
ncbi:hypothetical protein SAMN06265348_12410 [Pedobacter westerhofensis]|uniref:Uncharacterized protein n=1 Tax=Pedobacter westerhofensis TaxID=425512 RepID=A0A521FTX0_9SPHI|nr:hypothetical protein [Pedobacter westerhofensis]SMO99617.1 hypothetical protein SAMN06265348_12410 [Pedobacter westerhofensis]